MGRVPELFRTMLAEAKTGKVLHYLESCPIAPVLLPSRRENKRLLSPLSPLSPHAIAMPETMKSLSNRPGVQGKSRNSE